MRPSAGTGNRGLSFRGVGTRGGPGRVVDEKEVWGRVELKGRGVTTGKRPVGQGQGTVPPWEGDGSSGRKTGVGT